MATTTPNFGWPVPTSTDLVKDGATAMEALGDAIDTSMVDLKGGTTGQVLAKASSTDMDFSWTTPNPGDITGVTAGTGLTGGGTSGSVTLAVDPTYAGFTNMLYAKNAIINGGFDVWQRGTSFTNGNGNNIYGPDRWHIFSTSSTGRTWSQQPTNDTTNLPFIQYCVRAARNSGDTQTNPIYITSDLETVNSIPFAGKNVTFSFYARKGANWSGSGSLSVALVSGTGTDQNSLNGFTGSALPINTGAILTTTWQRFTFNATLASNITQLGTQIGYTPSGTAGAADYFEITGVQLEANSVATPFSRNGSSLQGELETCLRYFEKSYSQGTFAGAVTNDGIVWSDGSDTPVTNFYIVKGLRFQVPKRIAPTLTIYDGLGNVNKCTRSTVGVVDNANQPVTADNIGDRGCRVYSTGTSNSVMYFHYLASAEL